MTAILLAQLWWIMPIFIGLVYFALGFLVCKAFIKNNTIESVSDYWFYFILWLPLFVLGGLWSLAKWISKFPTRIAENQINKQ